LPRREQKADAEIRGSRVIGDDCKVLRPGAP
jgi:hypothetical protein